MIVIDTSALIAILQSEPEADAFQSLLEGNERCLIAAPTKLETLLVAAKRPTGPADVRSLIRLMGIQVADWTDALADIATGAFLRYGKGRHPAALNFGDCMSYALARSVDAPLLFKGGVFAKTDVRRAL